MKNIRISDAFLFFNEDHVCLLRLHYLHAIVDSFVILEGTHSFTGKSRDLRFRDQVLSKLKDYPEILAKIRYIPIDLSKFENNSNAWEAERFLRNSISTHLDLESEITLCSDCDEIPSIKWITDIKSAALATSSSEPEDNEENALENASIYTGMMLMFYGSPNNLMFDDSFKPVMWPGVFAAPNQLLSAFSPDRLRSEIRTINLIESRQLSIEDQSISLHLTSRVGWHLSYFGTKLQIQEKLGAFSHQEAEIQAHTSTAYSATTLGQDPFMRDYHFRLPMPEELFPVPQQEEIGEKIGYPKITHDYLKTACLQRILENSNSQLLSSQATPQADQPEVDGEHGQDSEAVNCDLMRDQYEANIRLNQTQLDDLTSRYQQLQRDFDEMTSRYQQLQRDFDEEIQGTSKN